MGIINNKIDFDNREFYLCHKYGTQFNPYVQSFFLINQDNIYYPLLQNINKDKQNHALSYDQIQPYLNKILTFYSISLEEKKNEELSINSNKNESDNESKSEIENKNESKNTEKDVIKTSTYQESQLLKLKLDELKSIATKHNINLQKISSISGKLIFKKKAELIEDLKLI